MGGTVSVKSKKDIGSTFTMWFRENQKTNEDLDINSLPKKADVLIIDDEKFVHDIMEKILKDQNYQIVNAYNAEQGFQVAKKVKPKVILLDEPMAALDPIIVQDIQNYILKLQSYGCGVIITDHQVQNLFEIVDRAYVIGEQTIIASGKPKEILKSNKARELYFGSFEN